MEKDAKKLLRKYDLRRVAKFFIDKNQFVIEVEDESATNLEKSIYAFVIDEKIK